MDAVQVKEYLVVLTGAGAAKAVFEDLENKKRAAFEKVFEDLTPEKKDGIRKAMNFKTYDKTMGKKGKSFEKSIDEDGQENAVDTFGSVKRGHGIHEDDWPAVQNAMREIVEITRKAIDKTAELKYPDGKPVYDLGNTDKAIREKAEKDFGTLIEIEVFTPLVREGLIPETLVRDQFSEVQKLLDNTFKNYRGTLHESIEEEKRKEAEREGKLHVEGGRLHKAKVALDRAKQFKDALIEKYGPSEETKAKLKIAKEGAKLIKSIYKAEKSISGWIPDEDGNVKALTKQDKFLNPEKYKSLLSEERQELVEKNPDPDLFRTQLEHQRQEDRLMKSLGKLGEKLKLIGINDPKTLETLGKNITKIREMKDEDWAYYTKAGSSLLLKDLIKGSVGVGEQAATIHGLDDERDKIVQKAVEKQVLEDAINDAVEEAIDAFDAAIVDGVAECVKNRVAGEVFSGIFENQIDGDALVAALTPEDDEEGGDEKKALELLANAISATFTKAAPTTDAPLFPAFTASAKAVADAFRKQAKSASLCALLKENAETAFDPVVKAARSAVTSGITVEMQSQLTDPKTQLLIAGKAAMPDEEEALEELRRSDEEIKDYERTLTLIDEAGITAAESRSIEKLITDLKRDKEILEMVLKLSGMLTGTASSSVAIANWASGTLTDVVAGSITGPLKAAQLIIQLAVNTKKAADRWVLWYKFKTDLERSKKAVSSMTSTIQGFLNNKDEQIAFHTIEDALLAVQAAAAILQSIPEPHVLAIGTTMSAVASASQQAHKVSGMIYNEAKLAEGWTVTKAAMNSPGDRALGLKALRLNTTLAMHAIAWAALEKNPPDPVARMVLNTLGISEQSLAVGGTEKKVRQYLEELLDEDRKFTDATKINVDWAPKDFKLCVKDWFVITSRAQTDAVPKFAKGPEKKVFEALKATDKHDLTKLAKDAETGAVDPDRMTTLLKEAAALKKELNLFDAKTTDGTMHFDMSGLADQFIKLAAEHETKLKEIADLNQGRRDPDRALNLLDEHLEVFELLLGPKGAEQDPPEETEVAEVEKLCDAARKDLSEIKAVKAFDANDDVQNKSKDLTDRLNIARFWILGKQQPRRRQRVRN